MPNLIKSKITTYSIGKRSHINIPSFKENVSYYSEWRKQFLKEKFPNITYKVGIYNYIKLLKVIDNKHMVLRKKYLNGISKTLNIDIKDSMKIPKLVGKARKAAMEVSKIAVDYCYTNGISYRDLLCPTVQSGDCKGSKLGKHIRKYAEKNLKLDEAAMKRLDVALSNLAHIWAANKTRARSLSVTVDTSMKGFEQLGHYEVDSGSCFNGYFRDDKYRIALQKDSFIILIKENNKIIARLWGWASKNRSLWHVTNSYYKNMTNLELQEVLQSFFDILLNGKTRISKLTIDSTYIYLNAGSQWTFCTNKDHNTLNDKIKILGSGSALKDLKFNYQ